MICTGRSGPNWLDRLRSSKGFPVSNGVDLEHFLNPNPKNDTIVENNDGISNDKSSEIEEKKKVVETTKKTVAKDQKNCEKEDLFGIMSSVLSELFNMGDSRNAQTIRKFDKKKSCRKQKNPKLCVFSESASVDDYVPGMSPSRADNSVTGEKKLGFGLELKKSVDSENLKARFSGYSRADVTIIDTSAPVWKSEKLVFRKGNVWKVWDRKSKCQEAFGGTKKRKSSQLSDSESVEKKQKKKKMKKAKKQKKMKKAIMLPNEVSPQNDETGAWRKTLSNLNQVPGKRHWFSRSPRKPAKKGSHVFHVQSTPSSRKNGEQLPNSSPLGMH